MPKFKKNPGKVWRPKPSYGMDTASILSDLGYSKEEIDGFANRKIVNVGGKA